MNHIETNVKKYGTSFGGLTWMAKQAGIPILPNKTVDDLTMPEQPGWSKVATFIQISTEDEGESSKKEDDAISVKSEVDEEGLNQDEIETQTEKSKTPEKKTPKDNIKD